MCQAPPEAQETQKGTKHSWSAQSVKSWGGSRPGPGLCAGEHSAGPVASPRDLPPILTTQPLYQVPLPLTHSPHRSNCHGADNGAELISTMPGHLRPPRRELGQCTQQALGLRWGRPHTPVLLSRAPPHSHLFLLHCTLATFCVTFAGVCLSGWLRLPLPGTDHAAPLPTSRPASQFAWHQRGGSTSWKVTDLF